MRYNTVSFILAAILVVGAQKAPASVTLSGQVIEKGTQTPISGARVYLYSDSSFEPVAITETLRNGSYILNVPSSGPYRIQVFSKHFFLFADIVTVSKNIRQRFDVPLAKLPTLKLRISNPPGAPSVTGDVRVTTWVETGMWQTWMLTKNGTIGPGGLVEVEVSQDHPIKEFQKMLVEVTSDQGCGEALVNGWQDTPIPIALKPGSFISGSRLPGRVLRVSQRITT